MWCVPVPVVDFGWLRSPVSVSVYLTVLPRASQLKKLRGVLIAGGADFDDLYRHLRLMEPALQLTVQDLR